MTESLGLSPQEMGLSDEQMKNSETRILSDADLIKGGAKIDRKGILQPTEDQVKDAKIEMGKDHYSQLENARENINDINEQKEELRGKFRDHREVNGFVISVAWEQSSSPRYSILVRKKDTEETFDTYTRTDEEAHKIFDAAVKFATEEGTTVNRILEQAEEEAYPEE